MNEETKSLDKEEKGELPLNVGNSNYLENEGCIVNLTYQKLIVNDTVRSLCVYDRLIDKQCASYIIYGEGRKVIICNPQFSSITAIFMGHKSNTSFVTTTNGKIFSGGVDGTINVWELRNSEINWIQSLSGRSCILTLSAIFWESSSLLISGDKNGNMSVWDADTFLSLLPNTVLDTVSIYSSAITPATYRLISFGGFSRIYVYDSSTLSHLTTLGGHLGPVMSLCVYDHLQDGSSGHCELVSGGEDKRILIWSLEVFAQKRELRGHGSAVTAIAVTEDLGLRIPLLVTGSRDRTVRIWDYLNGVALHTLTEAGSPVLSVSVSNPIRTHNSWLTAASGSKVVHIWNLSHIRNWSRRRHFVMAMSGSGILESKRLANLESEGAAAGDLSELIGEEGSSVDAKMQCLGSLHVCRLIVAFL